jgi:hypothetical protein
MLETGRNCLALSPCRRPYLDPSHRSSPENDQIQAKIEPPPLPSLGSGYGTTRSALRAGGQELAARKARDRAWGQSRAGAWLAMALGAISSGQCWGGGSRACRAREVGEEERKKREISRVPCKDDILQFSLWVLLFHVASGTVEHVYYGVYSGFTV